MTTINDFKQMRDTLNARIKEEGLSALKAAFILFFDQHPEIHALRWVQYTPYFNDGDTCTFSVLDAEYLLTEKAKVWGDDVSFVDDEDFVSYWGREDTSTDRDLQKFWDDTQDDEIFQLIFGDHVAVLATREGFTVTEYEHE